MTVTRVPCASKIFPRLSLIGVARPSTACAAVAPMHTMTSGFNVAISASSHPWHAWISIKFGFWWRRRLPRGSHLKCFTAFVT